MSSSGWADGMVAHVGGRYGTPRPSSFKDNERLKLTRRAGWVTPTLQDGGQPFDTSRL